MNPHLGTYTDHLYTQPAKRSTVPAKLLYTYTLHNFSSVSEDCSKEKFVAAYHIHHLPHVHCARQQNCPLLSHNTLYPNNAVYNTPNFPPLAAKNILVPIYSHDIAEESRTHPTSARASKRHLYDTPIYRLCIYTHCNV